MNWFVFVLFFISGACGLIYEVVWSRMMVLIFGRSVLAVGTVLAAFMTGIALGSYVLGKYADRSRNPLRLYSLYEIGVGLTAFLASFFLIRITPVYVWVHATFGESPLAFAFVRFFIAFTLLIIPTILMGATLPILSRVVLKRLSRVGQELGTLYAINTVGAVAGSLAAGFYLISRLGLHGAVDVAVFGNLVVGLLAWLASTRSGQTNSPAAKSQSATPPTMAQPVDSRTVRTYRLVLCAFALSGLASFAYEIFWTRSLVFLLGNTTYAFTLMLTAFLLGIALGGYGIRFLSDVVKNPLRLLAAIEILIGILSAIALPLLFFIVKSEAVHSFVVRYSGQLELLAVSNFVIALSLMLLPATLIGATLPLMGRIFVSDLQTAGTTVGKIYAVNTLGNVLGALLPGLFIVPLMGIQKGILLMAGLNVGLGIVLVLSRWKHAMVVVSTTVVVFLVFAFTLVRMSIAFQFPSEYQRPRDEVLFYREGGLVTTKVWVSADTGYKVISVDGINIGGTSDSDYKQQILAHLPKLLLKSYKSELSIGLGSGILIGESARHAALKKIVSVEISHGVVEGAKYFSEENFNILNDPRAVIIVDDVVDFLQTTTERFDIISADEKTAGKYATNSFSYSKEYYALLKQRLAPGGLVIQWMPTDLPPSQYDLAIRTFLDEFPHVQLWYFPPIGRFTMTNTFLIGSNDVVDIDLAWMRRTMETDPESFKGIRKYGLATAEAVLAHFVGNEETLRRAVPPGPVNTFEEPYYEFYSPADYAVPSNERTLVNHELLMSIRGQDFDRFVRKGVIIPEAGRLNAAFQAEEIFLSGHETQLRGFPPQEVISAYDRAISAAPWNENLRNQILSYLFAASTQYYSRGDYAKAQALIRRATEVYPQSNEAHYNYGLLLSEMGQTDLAEKELRRALALNPRYLPARRVLASIYESRGQVEQAIEQWKVALALDPDDVPTLVGYGVFLGEQRPDTKAIEYLRKAYRLDPVDPEVIDGYARVEYLSGNMSEARRIVLEGGNYYKGNPFFEKLRAAILGGN
ncbi:MAG: fused MFS/spermidine synthase [Betaproteobacteria bacterium]